MMVAGYLFDDVRRELLDGALTGYFGWAGTQLRGVQCGRALVSFRPRPEMLTPWGTLNGGVINGLVELPSFVAPLTELRPNELPVTNDLFLQHIRPLPGDSEYVLEGRLLRRGRSMAWTEVTVRVDDQIVTLARITKTIVASTRPIPTS
jgi:acyl-coenzyme A thioesterase PaaI-like protein